MKIVDQDLGALSRRLDDLQRQIEAMRSERRASATSVSGDFTVDSGGNIIINGGGSVQVNEGGDVIVDGVGTRAVLSDGSLTVIDDTSWPVVFVKKSEVRFIPSAGATPVIYGTDVGTGAARISGPGLIVPVLDTGSAANARIEPSGVLFRSTSSRRYKQDEHPVDIDPAAVLQLVAKTWRQRSDVEADPDTQKRSIGFIAEDLDDLGLTEFVEYDEQGRPDAIAYDRLSVALLTVAKDQHARLDRLEAAVAALTPPDSPEA